MDNAKKEERRQKMLNEPLLPLLVRMALPTMLGMLIMTLYNMTDTFFIGMLGNTSMTAAVGVAFSFVSVVQALGFWLGYGSGNVMSRALGAGDSGKAERVSACGLTLSLALSVVMIAVCAPMAEKLAAFMGGDASADLLAYATEYLRIIIWAVPFALFSTTLYNQIRLCGNAKDAVIGMMTGMLLNVVLDPVLILGFGMEIAGAAWATLIGQAAGAAVLCVIAGRHGNIPVNLAKTDFSGNVLYHILAGGAPNFSRQAITSAALILLNQAAARYSENTLTALTVSARIAAVAYMLMIGFSQGFQPICAMNYGAGQYDRVRKAFRMTVTIGTCFMCVMAVVLYFTAGGCMGLFTKDTEIIRTGEIILRWQCVSLPFLAFFATSSMYMQNIGKYGKALIISIARQGIFYIPLLFILQKAMGEYGLFVLQPAADILSFLLSVVIVRRESVRE